jgi:hypothetical protein
MNKIIRLIIVVLFHACVVAAQDSATGLRKGAWEMGLWAGGGHSVAGGVGDISLWNAGLRLGRVLSKERGPGFLRGNLQWALDVSPAYVVSQGATVYGVGISPLLTKWNFSPSSRVRPYLELGNGMLFSSQRVPPGASTFNFTTQAAVGVQVFRRENQAFSLSVRYEHISNAGLEPLNPGINSIQVRAGFSWFR